MIGDIEIIIKKNIKSENADIFFNQIITQYFNNLKQNISSLNSSHNGLEAKQWFALDV